MSSSARSGSRPRSRGRSLRGSTHVRLRVGLMLVAILLSIFGARLFQLQGVDAKSYGAMANAAGVVTLQLPAKRGRILDRDGVPLAESVSGRMIVADPTRTTANAEEIARILTDRLDLDYFDVLRQLTKKNDTTRFVYVARRIPSTKAASVMAELEKKKYVGVDSRPDPLRTYPAGDVGANLLGFLDTDGKPLAGLEQGFGKLLQGKDGTESFEIGGGNRIPLGENSRVKPVDGKDLRLTIDRDVQWYAQRVLRSSVQAARAKSGAAVVLDSRTGEVLALADYPTYDANAPGKSRKQDRGSRALADVYEPGSVEKVLTTAALLDKGLVTARTRFVVPELLQVLDRRIRDWFPHEEIHLTMGGVIAKSSNIGTALAATQMESETLRTYLRSFGLSQPTGVGLAPEGGGVVPAAGTWNSLTRAQVAFGQGLSVNALQMATAINAVANGGELITPSLVQGSARTDAGQEVGTATAKRHRVVSRSAAQQTAEMMELVTTPEVGTAPGAGIAGYRVAGKTGTAQQAGGACKCYQQGSLAVSFAGFAPADDPRFTVYVVVQAPGEGASGGGTAGPVFRKLLTYVLQKYAVAPTGTTSPVIPTQWKGRHGGSDSSGRPTGGR